MRTWECTDTVWTYYMVAHARETKKYDENAINKNTHTHSDHRRCDQHSAAITVIYNSNSWSGAPRGSPARLAVKLKSYKDNIKFICVRWPTHCCLFFRFRFCLCLCCWCRCCVALTPHFSNLFMLGSCCWLPVFFLVFHFCVCILFRLCRNANCA